MNREEYLSKLRDLTNLMRELASEDKNLDKAVFGLKDINRQISAYINSLEYDHALEIFCILPSNLQKQFILDAKNVYGQEQTQ
jgi:hypothetical protein